MFDDSYFIIILIIIFTPMAIFIKKAFQLRGLTWQAYIVALLGFVPVVNIVIFFISRAMVGYRDSLLTYILTILAPPTVFVYMFTSLFFEFPILEKIRLKKGNAS